MTEVNPGSSAHNYPPPGRGVTGPAEAGRPVIQYGPPPSYDAHGRLRAPVDADPIADQIRNHGQYPRPLDPNPVDGSTYYDLASYSSPGPGPSGYSPTDHPAGPRPISVISTPYPPAPVPLTYPAAADGGGPSAGRRGRRRRPGTSAVIGAVALVSAVLAAVAPMLTFWIGEYGSGELGDSPGHFHVNGFGHTFYGAVLDAGSPPGAHDTDYGVPLLVAAVLLALAAIALLSRLRQVIIGLLLAVVGGALSAGVAIEGVMDRGARFSLDDAHDHWSVGAGWWFMSIAGLGGAVLALAAGVLVARRTRSPAATLPVVQESWAGGAADLVGAPVFASGRPSGA